MSISRARVPIGLIQLLCLVAAGCGVAWQRIGLPSAGRMEPRQVLEVWHGREHPQWHGVILSTDSVSGIPFFQRLDCANCRRTVSRAEVDSLRFGDPVTPGVATALLPVAALGVLMLMVRLEGGHD
ncbi:MAG: hypothetical protein ABJC74_17905 [Gemmatimonadota bacterium]